MVLPPLRQQQLDIRLDETNRCDNVEIPHPMDYTDAERLVTLRKVDDHVGPGLPHMHVCRPVLPGRQTNAYLKPVDIEDGRHWKANLSVGLCATERSAPVVSVDTTGALSGLALKDGQPEV